MYLLMVVLMVGMNYSLKQRSKRAGRKEEDTEEEKVAEEVKSCEIRFKEGKGLITKIVEEDNDEILKL